MLTIARPESLVEQVVGAIKAEIAAGRFAASAKLPSEQALSEHLLVSRPVVREAISRLKADGLLVTRKGSGAFVSNNPAGNVFRLPANTEHAATLRDVFELRFWAEIAAAEMAALRRTPEQLTQMRTALDQMQTHASDLAMASAADLAFHNAIAHATHNPSFFTFIEFVSAQLLQARKVSWDNSAKYAGGSAPAQQEHLALYTAIEAQDATAARRAAKAHLLKAAKRLGIDLQEK